MTHSDQQEQAQVIRSADWREALTGKLSPLPSREEPRWSVLELAQQRLTENLKTYGAPRGTFASIAKVLTALGFKREGWEVTSTDVALALLALKLVRASRWDKRDNWVDIAGYAACAGELGDDFAI